MKYYYIYTFVIIILLFIISFLFDNQVAIDHKQEKLQKVVSAATTVRSIAPTDTNFNDLQFLKRTLKDVKIVLLGEQQHGDGATFLAKSRLIKYLHQEMNFDVLAYESGLYDCAVLWDSIQTHEICKPDLFSEALFWFWWQPKEVDNLLHYICQQRNTNHKLKIAGFDLQFSGQIPPKKRTESIFQYLSTLPEFDKASFTPLRNILDSIYFYTQFPGCRRMYENQERAYQMLNYLTDLREFVLQPGTHDRQDSLYAQAFRNMHDLFFYKWIYFRNNTRQLNFRDSVMAENLIWLKENLYPDDKLIVWAANSHNMNFEDAAGYRRMGSYIKQRYGRESYILNFTSHKGYNTNILNQSLMAINPSSSLSVENLLNKAGYTYAFLDFRSLPAHSFLRGEIMLKCLGHNNQRHIWSEMADGLFFIKEMQPLHIENKNERTRH